MIIRNQTHRMMINQHQNQSLSQNQNLSLPQFLQNRAKLMKQKQREFRVFMMKVQTFQNICSKAKTKHSKASGTMKSLEEQSTSQSTRREWWAYPPKLWLTTWKTILVTSSKQTLLWRDIWNFQESKWWSMDRTIIILISKSTISIWRLSNMNSYTTYK